jgi:alkaline phosphatase
LKSSAAIVTVMKLLSLLSLLLTPAFAHNNPRLDILLPERTRLLVRQRVDLVIETRHAPLNAKMRISVNGEDISARFSRTETDLDCDGTKGLVFRADLYEFAEAGPMKLQAALTLGNSITLTERTIDVKPFTPPAQLRNYILFIGDAMGNTYRDAGRIVGRSVETRPGLPGLREGFFDQWQQMDQMPVTGLVMTYGFANLVPDSAETSTHWSTGNKPLTGMLSSFPDGTDCVWRGGRNVATNVELAAMRDNPRIESFLEYLKRLHHYRTGNISTAFITDATPAGQGAHVAVRRATFEVARQYLENPMLGGMPAFDVIMGGGKEDFDPDTRFDHRDLVHEFQQKGFRFFSNRTELNTLTIKDAQVLGLFRRPNEVKTARSGLTVTTNGNMDVAYDKLKLLRPGSEPIPDFGPWTDQPFLDEMTSKAIEILAGPNGDQPFALQVEGGLIDKQSHPNHAAGTIWDVIELDKAVGVARLFSKQHQTLVLVTGDHNQTMSILGVAEISDNDLTDRQPLTTPSGTFYKDSVVNLRGNLPAKLPAELGRKPGDAGFPDYQDANGDGYPENREVDGKGRKRIAVGFRSDDHEGSSLPITAEGPGALFFTGYMDQTDIFFRSAQALTEDTTMMDRLLMELTKNKTK